MPIPCIAPPACALALFPGAEGPRGMALLLGLGTLAALGAGFLMLRPGAGEGGLDPLADRADLALRRLGVAFRSRKGEVWYRWALQSPHRERAVIYLEEAARRDHAEAAFELGLLNEEGGRGPGGRDAAARHFRAAADLGHLEAAYRLAELLRWGIGPSRDPGAAHRWYLRSAHGGFRPAMEWLIRAYEFGEGVGEDLEKAVYWTVKAQAQPPAGLRISHFARHHPLAPALPAPAPAREENGKGPGESSFRLGMGFLGEDRGRARDPIAARIWLLRAAEAGHVEAMAELGDLLACGVGGLAHAQEAAFWFQQAGRAGHQGAQIRLGQLEAPEGLPRR